MSGQDFHVHTSWCDGKNTPAEMAAAALEQGLTQLGFSGHSYTRFDESYCMSQAGAAAYRQEIAALKRQYAGRLTVWCGVEQDFYADASTAEYDYVIGSVHYLLKDGVYLPVDESRELLQAAANEHYHGDFYALAEDYFRTVGQVVEKTGADIIGHLDLISKFNEDHTLFDERHPRYVAAWQGAIDRLLPCDRPFELNTGAISRGYRSAPYPSPDMLRYIKSRGGRLLLSSDSHSRDSLCYQFDRWQALAEELGFTLPQDGELPWQSR